MARGGFRPGGGRPKGSKDSKPRKRKPTAKKPVKPKKAKKPASKKEVPQAETEINELAATIEHPDPPPGETGTRKTKKLDPLTYMLKVMNDPDEEKEMRARMAIASAPFVHARMGDGKGKKQERADKAGKAGKGRFKPTAPPKLKAVK